MAEAISKYYWDLGNGETSSSPTPTSIYGPGKYTVKLIAVTTSGIELTVEEIDFIIVTEDQQTLFNEKYLTDPKSFHYGTNASIASGWSENAGANWIWPGSQASITHESIDGIDYLLVWDMFDGKQYCINPRETAFSSIVHKDKDTNEISCSVTFPSVTGESADYQIMHQQTKFQLRNDIDTGERPTGMSIYMSLIGQEGEILEKVKAVPRREVIFKEQSTYDGGEHDNMQIKFESDKSGYLLTSYESIYKTIDKCVASLQGSAGDTAALVADVVSWLTVERNYLLNLGTGAEVTSVWTNTTGPDGSTSAINLTSDLDIENASSTGTLMFWYKGVKPVIGVSTTDSVVSGGFTLTYYSGIIPANITFPFGSELFDIRITSSELDLETIEDYGNNYKKHVGGL